MNYPIKKEKEKYTYGDYLTWQDDERWELIDGIAYNMSPAPSTYHQEISLELAYQIRNYLKDKSCKVYCAPFDVRLPKGTEKDEDIDTVVQPDIVVIYDHSKIDEKGCRGAPDLVIEILSPHTSQKDIKEKFFLYEKVAVKEYWIVHPTDKTVIVFKLDKNNKYERPDMYTREDKIKVSIFDDLTIDLNMVFEGLV